jgi:hypothetical protein
MGEQKEILAGSYNQEHYRWPKGFIVDEWADDPDNKIQDDPTLQDMNSKVKCVELINYSQTMIDTRTNDENIMLLMGDDFAFGNAYISF